MSSMNLEDRQEMGRPDEAAGEAQDRFDRLMAASPEERPALATTLEMRDLRLAELLLQASFRHQPAEPAACEELAGLALRIAAQAWPPEAAARADDLRARAAVLLGTARRLAGDRDGAEEWFQRAVGFLTCPPNAPERALYCQHLAALRRDQGREDEAAGALWRAAQVYNENADFVEEAACLAELGFLLLAEDHAHRAVYPLARACEGLELHRDSTLSVRARLALAVCHARLGQAPKALRILKSARAMYDRIAGSPRELADVTWMEGKVAAFAGSLEDAQRLLDMARRSFVTQKRLYEAGFATLDLVAALARLGRLESLGALVREVSEEFPADIAQAGVLRALGLVEAALARGLRGGIEEVVAEAAGRLRGYRRNPLLAFEGERRA